MNIRVLQGTIKHNDRKYGVGETVEVADDTALAIIRNGVAEEIVEESKEAKKARIKAEKAEKEEAKKVEEVKAEEVEAPVIEAEPSEDWTRKEIEEYALAHGIKEPEKFENKTKLLKAIGGETK